VVSCHSLTHGRFEEKKAFTMMRLSRCLACGL
jgi:hypothetical protein